MPKRARPDQDDDFDQPSAKKGRTGPRRSLSALSDEILLRVLSFLTFKDLLVTECVSSRFRALATDRELWKARYYDAWVKSRLRRRPLRQRQDKSTQIARPAQWLEADQRFRLGGSADWKRQYKIRSNWDIGTARVREVEIAQPPSPPAIANVHQNLVFTADKDAGLRVWSQNDGARALRSQIDIESSAQTVCMAVADVQGGVGVVLGFDDGSFSLYLLRAAQDFSLECSHLSSDGPLVAVALMESHIMTISKTKFLSIYHLQSKQQVSGLERTLTSISRLQADASFSPVSVALRKTPGGGIVGSVAYAFKPLQSEWCLGLQEVCLFHNGQIMNSRLASTIDTRIDTPPKIGRNWEVTSRSTSTLPLALHPQLMSAPTSLSYEHPFVVCSLSDNTLMSYLVTSSSDSLEIRSGRRLWGHTSAVSGVQVNGRGKAVSISSKGEEIRAWELEEVMTAVLPRRTSTAIKGVDEMTGVVAALARRGSGLSLALDEMKREQSMTRRWVGFDDEQVVILGDRDQTQILSLYDFT